MYQNASPQAQKRLKTTCLSIPSGLGTTLETMFFFFGLGTLVGAPLAPTCAGRVAFRLHRVTSGKGVYASRGAILSLGTHKKWRVAGGVGALGIRFRPT